MENMEARFKRLEANIGYIKLSQERLETKENEKERLNKDEFSFFEFLLCFLAPYIGLLVYIILKGTQRRRANSALIISMISIFICLIGVAIMYVMGIAEDGY